jgi:dGTP triphosphohydrolase
MKTLIMDLLNTSLHKEKLGYSELVFDALKELKKFNYDKIYSQIGLFIPHNSNISYLEDLTHKCELIFEESLKDLESKNIRAPIFKDHIEYIDDEKYSTYYELNKEKGNLGLIVRDYIAGMSDKYFQEVYNRIKRK